MSRRTPCVFVLFLVLVVAAACGGGGETPSEPAATAPAAPADEATAGNVTGMVMLSKYLPRLAVFRQLAPPNPTPSEVQTDDPYRGLARVGDVGDAVSALRPAGKARFGGMLIDVVTQGDYIEPPARVEVIERRGSHVVVRAIG